ADIFCSYTSLGHGNGMYRTNAGSSAASSCARNSSSRIPCMLAAESVGNRCQGANNFEIARATCFMQRPRAVFAARPGYYGFHRLLDQWFEERTVALMQCLLLTQSGHL